MSGFCNKVSSRSFPRAVWGFDDGKMCCLGSFIKSTVRFLGDAPTNHPRSRLACTTERKMSIYDVCQHQMAYFQLHQPTSSLVKELLADLRPEHSEDWKVTSVTSRLAALC